MRVGVAKGLDVAMSNYTAELLVNTDSFSGLFISNKFQEEGGG